MENHEKMTITTTVFVILFLNGDDNNVKTLGNIYIGIANCNLLWLITPSLGPQRNLR